jgi:hypothetical protein
MTTTLTITRALKEIETLTDRISKLNTNNSNFQGYLAVAPSDLKSTNRQAEIDKFLKDGAAQYQSVTTLIARRDKIKSLVILSNATNTVTIGSNTFTVAEAIEKKKTININKQLLDFLKKEQQAARFRLEKELVEYNRKLEAFITNAKAVEKAEKGKDADQDFVARITAGYANTNYPKIYEPFKFSEEITKLEDYIRTFEDEVDIALSEANATNTITIPD